MKVFDARIREHVNEVYESLEGSLGKRVGAPVGLKPAELVGAWPDALMDPCGTVTTNTVSDYQHPLSDIPPFFPHTLSCQSVLQTMKKQMLQSRRYLPNVEFDAFFIP